MQVLWIYKSWIYQYTVHVGSIQDILTIAFPTSPEIEHVCQRKLLRLPSPLANYLGGNPGQRCQSVTAELCLSYVA